MDLLAVVVGVRHFLVFLAQVVLAVAARQCLVFVAVLAHVPMAM